MKKKLKKMLKKKKPKSAFSLAEILIVVAIIGVLVAISLPIFSTQMEKSREETDIANMRAARMTAVALYNSDDEVNGIFYWDAEQGALVKPAFEFSGPPVTPIAGYGKGAAKKGGCENFTPIVGKKVMQYIQSTLSGTGATIDKDEIKIGAYTEESNVRNKIIKVAIFHNDIGLTSIVLSWVDNENGENYVEPFLERVEDSSESGSHTGGGGGDSGAGGSSGEDAPNSPLKDTAWVINDTVSFSPYATGDKIYNINFVSASITYTQIQISGTEKIIYFTSSDGEKVIAYQNGHWVNEAYKNLMFKGGGDLSSTTFTSWLEQNGILQGN